VCSTSNPCCKLRGYRYIIDLILPFIREKVLGNYKSLKMINPSALSCNVTNSLLSKLIVASVATDASLPLAFYTLQKTSLAGCLAE
jgi:hypothetical protein